MREDYVSDGEAMDARRGLKSRRFLPIGPVAQPRKGFA